MLLAIITKNIYTAKGFLDDGNLVAIPTETVYGLAANGTDTEALKKIFETKGRPINNPLILHFTSLESMAPYVCGIPEAVKLLARNFWPGPLTLLLPKSSEVPEVVTAGSARVAVRIPNHPLTLDLLQVLDYPLAAPSANPSGYISPTKPEHVQQQLGDKIPLILDGGPCKSGIESTILGWDETFQPVIYRPGTITLEEIARVLNTTPRVNREAKVLLAPGMSSSHYAPQTPTITTKDVKSVIEQYEGKKVGLIAMKNSYPEKHVVKKEFVLSPNGSLSEIARKLYAAMYSLDTMDLDVIIIELAPDEGIGKAINDRLVRSSTSNTP